MIKESVKKHPDHPSRDPLRSHKEALGREWYKDMKFANEGARQDYLNMVKSNDFNVLGLPAFYPATEVKASISSLRKSRECLCGGCAIASDRYICPRCREYVE